MENQNLICSFVARGAVVLAEYTFVTGKFLGVATQYLRTLPASNKKYTYSNDGCTYNFLVDNEFTYCVVAVGSVNAQLLITFFERVKRAFNNRYGGAEAATAPPKSFSQEFGPKLKENMQYCSGTATYSSSLKADDGDDDDPVFIYGHKYESDYVEGAGADGDGGD